MNTYQIFLDLDGVCVNWNKGYIESLTTRDPQIIEETGYDIVKDSPWIFEDKLYDYFIKKGESLQKARNKAKERFWSHIDGDFDWWVNLEWMSDGRELLNYCIDLKNKDIIKQLNILTSPSEDPVCEPGKRKWLDKHNITNVFDNIYVFKKKYMYAKGSYDILIDDTHKKIHEWITISSGTGILHTSTTHTISKLKEILGIN